MKEPKQKIQISKYSIKGKWQLQMVSDIIKKTDSLTSLTDNMESMNITNIGPACILSHGQYAFSTFLIPYNIALIQYTTPRKQLNALDAIYLMNHYKTTNDNLHSPYLQNKLTGDIYQPDGVITRHSNIKVDDLQLRFATDPIIDNIDKILKTRVIHPNNVVSFEDEARNILLSELLNLMSEQYERLYPDKIINVYQFSCRLNEYVSDFERAKEELTSSLTAYKSYNDIASQYQNEYATGYLEWVNRNYTQVELPQEESNRRHLTKIFRKRKRGGNKTTKKYSEKLT